MPSLLITGGGGFIGSALTEYLLDQGLDIVILDNRDDPKNSRKIMERIDYINGDIRDRQKLKEIFDLYEIHGIVHLAAVSRVVTAQEDPNLTIDVNIEGTRNILDAVKEMDAHPWIIYGSSREVYGECGSSPVKESDPKLPINVYGRSKLESEMMVERYSKEMGLKSCSLRFSNVYGNKNDILDRVIPRFIISALTDEPLEIHGGNQVFDFTHIEDTIDCIRRCMKYVESKGNGSDGYFYDVFHVVNGKGITLQELAGIISRKMDKELEIVYTDPRNYDVERFTGDPSKAMDLLGFKARTSVNDGVTSTVDLYRKLIAERGKHSLARDEVDET